MPALSRRHGLVIGFKGTTCSLRRSYQLPQKSLIQLLRTGSSEDWLPRCKSRGGASRLASMAMARNSCACRTQISSSCVGGSFCFRLQSPQDFHNQESGRCKHLRAANQLRSEAPCRRAHVMHEDKLCSEQTTGRNQVPPPIFGLCSRQLS